jgi:hypothetical protein
MTTILVTVEDITNGIRHDCAKCPIALAATRAFGKPVIAGALYLQFWGGNGYRQVSLPHDVRDWIIAFDSNRLTETQPFEFTVDTK